MDIMIDLETLGTKPGSVILSIGAVAFNRHADSPTKTLYRNITRSSCHEAGLTANPATIKWWSEQSQEARDSLLVDQIPLLEAVNEFSAFYIYNGGKYIWANGSHFDCVLWESACRAFDRSPPWKYNEARDFKTACEALGFEYRSFSRAGVAHNALADALHQVACLQTAFRSVKNTDLFGHVTP